MGCAQSVSVLDAAEPGQHPPPIVASSPAAAGEDEPSAKPDGAETAEAEDDGSMRRRNATAELIRYIASGFSRSSSVPISLQFVHSGEPAGWAGRLPDGSYRGTLVAFWIPPVPPRHGSGNALTYHVAPGGAAGTTPRSRPTTWIGHEWGVSSAFEAPTTQQSAAARSSKSSRSSKWKTLRTITINAKCGTSQLLDLNTGAVTAQPDSLGLASLSLKPGKRVAQLIDVDGADPNGTNASGHTPLYLAARQDHLTVMKLLREAGAYINANEDTQETPLMGAVDAGSTRAVRWLLEQGADWRTVIAGTTALAIARKRSVTASERAEGAKRAHTTASRRLMSAKRAALETLAVLQT